MTAILILIAVNTLGWLVLQLSIAALFTRLDTRRFEGRSNLYRTFSSEIHLYLNLLQIRRWKRLLPDGAPWVGGSFRKRRLLGRDPAYLRQFVLETRRGETAHWIMLLCCSIFFLWNPPWAWSILIVYAAAANLPCIAVQRYNRHVLQRILARTARVLPETSSHPSRKLEI